MTPSGTSNELDVQNEWEENTHAQNVLEPVALVAQLVTSKPSATLGREFESQLLEFFLTKRKKKKIEINAYRVEND